MAQIKKEGPKKTLSFKAAPSLADEVERAHKAEGGEVALTQSAVLEHLLGQGLAYYFAVESVGAERMEALLATTPGQTPRERELALVERIVRLGAEHLEAESGKKRK